MISVLSRTKNFSFIFLGRREGDCRKRDNQIWKKEFISTILNFVKGDPELNNNV